MAVLVRHDDWYDASLTADALLVAARQADADGKAGKAARLRRIANDYGDALDAAIPVPSGHPWQQRPVLADVGRYT